jgi:cytochrome c-type biogenesis protein CcmH
VIEFWLAALGLLLVALSFVLVPLWRRRRQSGQWSIAGLVSAGVLVPITLAVYLSVSTWQTDVEPNPSLPAIAEMVDTLAERLRENPDDANGWLMLGRSYVATGRYPDALVAFREAWDRTPEPGVELKVSIAEVEALTDPAALGGSAGRLFDEVLAEDPSNEKTLWYGGLAALQAGDADLVRQRWSALLAIGVPEPMAQVMQEQLAALPPAGASAAVGQSGSAPAPADDGFAIQLNVTLGTDVAATSLAPQSALFIFARAPEGGPPLAVIREAATSIPGEFADSRPFACRFRVADAGCACLEHRPADCAVRRFVRRVGIPPGGGRHGRRPRH